MPACAVIQSPSCHGWVGRELESFDAVSLCVVRVVQIVRYYGAARRREPIRETGRTTQKFYILLEYVPGGSIASLLKRFGRFPVEVVRACTCSVISDSLECRC